MAEWERVVSTTIRKYAKGYSDQTMRNNKLFALLQQQNRVMTGQSGVDFDWAVRVHRAPLQANTGQSPRVFAQKKRFKRAVLDWRGYEMNDAMYKRERLMNRSKEALIKYYSEMGKLLLSDMREALAEECWQDGNASGNEDRFHGIESFMGINGTVTINGTGAVQRSANAADKYGYASDTYAGLSTQTGQLGGTQASGTWPFGVAQPAYDAFTPLVVNVTSTAWTKTSGNTWAANCDECVRESLINAQRNKSSVGPLEFIDLNRSYYAEFLDKIDTKERIVTSSKLGLRALGFKDVFEFDGAEVTWENSVPDSTGYGININDVELMMLTDQLIDTEGPEYDIDTQAHKVVVSCLGNMKFGSPRNHMKFQEIA